MTTTTTEPTLLSTLLLERPDQEPEPGQTAEVEGNVVRLRAVLTRTAVIDLLPAAGGRERRVVRLDAVMVDPSEIRWRPRTEPGHWNRQASLRGRSAAHRNRSPGDRTKGRKAP